MFISYGTGALVVVGLAGMWMHVVHDPTNPRHIRAEILKELRLHCIDTRLSVHEVGAIVNVHDEEFEIACFRLDGEHSKLISNVPEYRFCESFNLMDQREVNRALRKCASAIECHLCVDDYP